MLGSEDFRTLKMLSLDLGGGDMSAFTWKISWTGHLTSLQCAINNLHLTKRN